MDLAIKVISETTTIGLMWPVVPLVQSDCMIIVNHPFLWKESIDTLVFCMELVIKGG